MTTKMGLAVCLTMVLLANCAERVSSADDREQASSFAGPDAVPACATNTTPGDHTVTCGGLRVDLRVPALCPPEGCGLILVLHGDTGTGLLEDAHVRLREHGAEAGYIVVAPTGPPFGGSGASNGSTWSPANDATLIAIVGRISDELRVDRRRIHVTEGPLLSWQHDRSDRAAVRAAVPPAQRARLGQRSPAVLPRASDAVGVNHDAARAPDRYASHGAPEARPRLPQ